MDIGELLSDSALKWFDINSNKVDQQYGPLPTSHSMAH